MVTIINPKFCCMLNMQKDQTIITDKIPDAIIEKTACIYGKARERGL